MTLDIETVTQQSPLLGRQKVHDERSRAFAAGLAVDRSTWKDTEVRLYDPWPNPNQPVGCCTHVAKAHMFNSVGNRRPGVVLKMDWILKGYARNTVLDPFPGTFVYDEATGLWSGDDTGSSGLASCKTAQETRDGGPYGWLFGGADEVVQYIVEKKRAISAGTWWYGDMFGPSGGSHGGDPILRPTGGTAGGHQYILRGYALREDLVEGRCMWGSDFRDFWIKRTDLDTLLRDGGDAHFQERVLA